jgi:hypothetical protein
MIRSKSIAGLLVIVCGSMVLAQPLPPLRGEAQEGERIPVVAPFGPHQGGGPAGLPVTLDITELQKQLADLGIPKISSEKTVTIVRGFLDEFSRLLIQVKREELNIQEELLKEKPDLKVIQGIVARKAKLFSEIEFAQIKRDIDIKAVLTRDEYERWKSEIMKKMRRMMPPATKKGQSGPDDSSGPGASDQKRRQ